MPDNVMRLNRPTNNLWMAEITRGDHGPHATVGNALLMLVNDPALSGLLAYNEFSYRVMVTRSPPPPFTGATLEPGPYPRPAKDTDITLIQSYLQRTGLRIGQAIAQQAADAAALQNKYHPVRDWLDNLEWDGVPRVEKWLETAFGVPDDEYHRAVATKFLVAAVRRVRQPGCKFDAMPVLEGLQEIGKSTSCRALFGADWYSDEMPDMRTREAPISMLGVWGVEVAELGAIIRTELEVVKAFITRQVDRYREMHGKRYEDRPRQTMLIGTTNDNDYLRDSTGNRRFWPFYCIKAEPGWIADNREQLWAEAARYEAEGEVLWLDSQNLREIAKTAQAERVAEDMWTSAVRAYLGEGTTEALAKVKVSDILHHGLGLPRDKQNRASEMRVAGILKGEGWRVRVVWEKGKSTRIWEPSSAKDDLFSLTAKT